MLGDKGFEPMNTVIISFKSIHQQQAKSNSTPPTKKRQLFVFLFEGWLIGLAVVGAASTHKQSLWLR